MAPSGRSLRAISGQSEQKPRIEIPPGMLRSVGRWSSQFATETKFDIDLHISHVERAVTRFLGQRFREFRCRLHKFYKKAGSDRRRCEKPYDGVSLEDWEKITTWFETDKFKVKKLSVQNKGNCAKKVVHHRGGSKSFSNYREEKNKMLEIKSQPLEEGSEPRTEDEIAEMVLGKKPGYNRGLGHGVEPISSSSAYRNSKWRSLEGESEAAERHAHESRTTSLRSSQLV
ncbi:hypothetical protein IFM89_024864 [Coptis chinensis]|uniref:Transposase n=1 Tax=Coptis chinensis TaxID=261450 RepID=A0A835HPR2_9MAGN|nr:hypothetical protein IFM89_024864 [Coptis chinensis]